MSNSPQSDVAQLDTYYNHTLDNSGTDQFYRFLYRYVDTVVTDSQLFDSAMRFWLESLVSDFQKDEKKLEQFAEKMTALVNKPKPYQTIDFFLSTFKLIDTTKIKETKPYYCWYELYNCYYGLRASSINAEHIKKLSTLDLKSKEVKELLGDVQLSDKQIAEFKTLDFDKFSAAFELETQSVIPTKTKLSRDDYLSCLIIFHTDFKDWLQTNSQQISAEAGEETAQEEVVYIGNAKIDYKDYMTYVTLPNEKKPLKLRKKYVKRDSGYDYFLSYMFDPKNEGKLITGKAVQVLNIKCEGYSDVGDVLRHCGFNKCLKRVFMPKRDSTFFEYKAEAPITQQQVNDIKRSISKIKQ